MDGCVETAAVSFAAGLRGATSARRYPALPLFTWPVHHSLTHAHDPPPRPPNPKKQYIPLSEKTSRHTERSSDRMAHRTNHASSSEITPVALAQNGNSAQMVPHRPSPAKESTQSPRSPFRRVSDGRISKVAKQALLDNLELERMSVPRSLVRVHVRVRACVRLRVCSGR